jgi:isochorismate synthase
VSSPAPSTPIGRDPANGSDPTDSSASAGEHDLVARTWRVTDDIDLLAVAGEHGPLWARGPRGFAGRGQALRIEVPAGDPAAAARVVHQAMDTIDILSVDEGPDGEPDRARGPVALGALPFDPAASGTLVVPEILVERTPSGSVWVTTVGPRHHDARPTAADLVAGQDLDHGDDDGRRAAGVGGAGLWADAGGTVAGGPQPTRYAITSPRSPEAWCAALVEARDQLRAGRGAKVVLARQLQVETDQPLSRRAVLTQLRRAYPAAMLFAIGGFVGASPELLVERTGQLVRSHPMAGTAPRHGDPERDAAVAAHLVASTKNQGEHRFTIDMVHDTLLPWCSYLDEEAEPSVVAMANVAHLATRVEGKLSSPPASVIELMRALHPTPAVNGVPRHVALELIAECEGFNRGCYGGPVGWVDAEGNGAWTVGIRSAQIDGNRAQLFAGVGVVADSDPAAELAETRAKFEALLNAIVRP